MRKQEETRLAENEAEKVIYQVALAQSDIVSRPSPYNKKSFATQFCNVQGRLIRT